jgi:hypothetical protein
MNLVQGSANGSWEVGVVIVAQEQPEVHKQLLAAAAQLLQRAELQHKQAETLKHSAMNAVLFGHAPPQSIEPKGARQRVSAGACIACATPIPQKLDRPFCRSCYAAWSGAEAAKMSFCHTCGEAASTSFQKARCKACWSQGIGAE